MGESLFSAVLSHTINYGLIYIWIIFWSVFIKKKNQLDERKITLILLRLKLKQRKITLILLRLKLKQRKITLILPRRKLKRRKITLILLRLKLKQRKKTLILLRLKLKQRRITQIRKDVGVNKHKRLPNCTYRKKLKWMKYSFPKSTKYVFNIHGARDSLK